MIENPTSREDKQFRLTSGAVIRAGWLQDDLPFLTRSLRHLLRTSSENLRLSVGLEAGDIGVMAVVSLNPGVTQNDLAASLVLKKSAVTRVVQRLEKRGFVERRRCDVDRRANRLTLTAAGEDVAQKIKIAAQAQQLEWFDGVSQEESAIFFDVLLRLIVSMAETRAPNSVDQDGI
jgi:DNA-binding MarR family transcriptional regulator